MSDAANVFSDLLVLGRVQLKTWNEPVKNKKHHKQASKEIVESSKFLVRVLTSQNKLGINKLPGVYILNVASHFFLALPSILKEILIAQDDI